MPKLEDIKAANPNFFTDANIRVFGDVMYTVFGQTLRLHSKREDSLHREVRETVDYAIDPKTLELRYILMSKEDGRRFVFVQPNENGPVLRQYLKANGEPEGEPC